MPDADALCGLPHRDWPETVCTQPAGRHGRDQSGEIHAGPLVIGGRECGAAAWTVLEAGR